MLRKILRKCGHKGITGLETAIILIAFVVVAAVFAYTVLSAGLFSTQKSSEAVYNGLKEASNTLVTRGSLLAYKGGAGIGSSVGRIEFAVSTSTTKGTEAVDLTAPYTFTMGTVDTITVGAGGSGYTSAPTVTVSGGGGTGCTATATLTADAVTSVTVVTAGSGFVGAPTVIFSGGGGSGATATATLTGSALTIDATHGLNTPAQISFTDNTITLPRCAWTLSWVGKHSTNYLLSPGEQAVITVWLHNISNGVWSDGTTANGFINTDHINTYHTFNLEVKTASGAVLNLQRSTPALLEDVMDLH